VVILLGDVSDCEELVGVTHRFTHFGKTFSVLSGISGRAFQRGMREWASLCSKVKGGLVGNTSAGNRTSSWL